MAEAAGRREIATVAIALFAICFIAHFLHWQSIGLYEDDFHFGAPALTTTWGELARGVGSAFEVWPQGRPIGWSIGMVLPVLADRIVGFRFAWTLLFVILSATAILAYMVFRDILPRAFAFFAAVFFCVYPADVFQLFQHGLITRATIPAFLLACLAYRAHRPIVCYALAAFTFLSAEFIYACFFAIPLLYAANFRDLWKRLIVNGAILSAILAAALCARAWIGDDRVQALQGHVAGTIARVLRSMMTGPFTSIRLSIVDVASTIRQLDRESAAVLVAAALLTGIASRALQIGEKPRPANPAKIGFVCGCGVIFVALSYALVFRDPYFPPTFPYGRLTIVHTSGAFGASMLAGGIAWGISHLAAMIRIRPLAFAGLCIYAGSLAAFHDRVQREFARVWDIERTFWTNVVAQCPDLEDGTVVIHEQRYNYVNAALANSWADALVLPYLFEFRGARVPRLFSLPPSWRDGVQKDQNGLKWFVPAGDWAPYWDRLDVSKLIVLEQTGPGQIRRRTGPIRFAGEDYVLKPPGPRQDLARGPLFQFLIR